MRSVYDLSRRTWRLSGWTPYQWLFEGLTSSSHPHADVPGIEVKAPGSVQGALRRAGVIPDWNEGLKSRDCEWIENRHWIYETRIPDVWLKGGGSWRLKCLGLDYAGWVFVNGREAGRFQGSFTPHVFDLTPFLRKTGNSLCIIFDCPPRWLGQFGFTSRIRDWKPRFNYTWDWTARLVQTGIWDALYLESGDSPELDDLVCLAGVDPADGTGRLRIRGRVRRDAGRGKVRLCLEENGSSLRSEEVTVRRFAARGCSWDGLPVRLWWPNLQGEQPLYTLSCSLLNDRGEPVDVVTRRVGFKCLDWQPCRGAPAKAGPWLCVVNGRPVFLQGVNWTPVRPDFADVTPVDYRRRLQVYRRMGCNILRVWGGGYLEKQCFYDLCDEMGFLVWQEFPLCSSGLDNWPPEDESGIAAVARIAESYISRRRHHVSLALWCGGNELQGGLDGSKTGIGKPVGDTHPLIQRLRRLVAGLDPGRRFLAASAGGPRFMADKSDFGKGLHWDVHGPWKAEGGLENGWRKYWENDDALFRSEVGAPGANSVSLIRRFRGDLPELPGDASNPLWRRGSAWWTEWGEFVKEQGREPETLEEYVRWSRQRQADALAIAVAACQKRFPSCGGIIIWMGHDSFPCAANTSIIDYLGRPKPAAARVGRLFRSHARLSKRSSQSSGTVHTSRRRRGQVRHSPSVSPDRA